MPRGRKASSPPPVIKQEEQDTPVDQPLESILSAAMSSLTPGTPQHAAMLKQVQSQYEALSAIPTIQKRVAPSTVTPLKPFFTGSYRPSGI